MASKRCQSNITYNPPYLTPDPRLSTYEVTPYGIIPEDEFTYPSTSATHRLRIIGANSTRPLSIDSKRASNIASPEEVPSPLPSATLKRSSHIRRKEGPKKARMPRPVLPRITTDFSRKPSGHSTSSSSTLWHSIYLESPPFLSSTRSSPSLKSASKHCGTSTGDEEEEGEGEESPSSIYSAMSAAYDAPIFVEWGGTGYLQPHFEGNDIYDDDDDDESPEAEPVGGGVLKRQKTEVITRMLQDRFRRAGLE